LSPAFLRILFRLIIAVTGGFILFALALHAFVMWRER
jgi:hypothetical protein